MDDYWGYFENAAREMGSPLYERLAGGVRGDDTLKEIAALARAGQPHANMLFGAVHFLLLRGASHPLREFYPTLGGTKSPQDEELFSLFRDFVLQNRPEISALVATRVTNTNEVGRSAVLHAGFRRVAQEAGEPLTLIELGPSAGLNLIWDRYGVRYRRGTETIAAISPDAGLVIDCELKGEGIPPTGPSPKVAFRLGLELNPVDLANRDDRDWLRALFWPDQVTRLERLDRAVALFHQNRPSIRSGDALKLLPSVLAAAPPGPVCVYHTSVVYQFSTGMKQTLDALLTNAGRPLYRLGLEYDGAGDSLVLSRYGCGSPDQTLLARSHPHGTWMDWQG